MTESSASALARLVRHVLILALAALAILTEEVSVFSIQFPARVLPGGNLNARNPVHTKRHPMPPPHWIGVPRSGD